MLRRVIGHDSFIISRHSSAYFARILAFVERDERALGVSAVPLG